jgi:hypothetical protein
MISMAFLQVYFVKSYFKEKDTIKVNYAAPRFI